MIYFWWKRTYEIINARNSIFATESSSWRVSIWSDTQFSLSRYQCQLIGSQLFSDQARIASEHAFLFFSCSPSKRQDYPKIISRRFSQQLIVTSCRRLSVWHLPSNPCFHHRLSNVRERWKVCCSFFADLVNKFYHVRLSLLLAHFYLSPSVSDCCS